MPLRFDQLTPAVFIQAGVSGSANPPSYQGPETGFNFIVCGMDAYGANQPNNGELQVEEQFTHQTLWLIQQSQNFPGPFAWRGFLPFTASPVNITVVSSIPFDFQMWGLIVPDFSQDSSPM